MFGIAVGGDLDFVTGPGFHSELSGNLMGLLIGDVLPGGEGLNILIEVDAVHLAVCRLGSFELQNGIHTIAVDTTNQSALRLLVPGLVLPHTVVHHGSHSTEVLLGFPDISHSCDTASPPRLMR